VPALIKLLSDEHDYVRAYAAGAIGKMGKDASPAVTVLGKTIDDSSPMVRDYAIRALGSIGCNAHAAIPKLTAKLKGADQQEKSLVIETLAEIALQAQDQNLLDVVPPLQQARAAAFSAPELTNSGSFHDLDRSLKYLELLGRTTLSGAPQRQRICFESIVPPEIMGQKTLLVNGTEIEINGVAGAGGEVYYLGKENILERGLNLITAKGSEFRFWLEENKLKAYTLPYAKSYAIIVAIDDYDRSNDPERRGPTRYRRLSFMVEHAKRLVSALEGLGFPRENILEFYNSAATSKEVTGALNKFWAGGDFSNADRLFFYFGGHGDAFGPAACLLTYDFDQARPGLTSLLMRDITGRHFGNISARHVLVAIDSCFAGLALPQFLSPELDEERLKAFRTLSIIQSETARIARDVIVSGTGDQRALWENGGIFTQALVSGLKGDADLNGDGVIQFDELALYVKNEVRAKARQTGVVQEPNQWRADHLGRGNVIFLRTGRSTPK
jgi:hypothetical protein